jgi:hypothetical protein
MFIRRRRPLMRATMVGGTAYYAGKKMRQERERQAEQEYRIQELGAQQGAASAAPVAAPVAPASLGGAISSDAMAQLKQLAELKDSGALTEEEFEVQKRRLLGTS